MIGYIDCFYTLTCIRFQNNGTGHNSIRNYNVKNTFKVIVAFPIYKWCLIILKSRSTYSNYSLLLLYFTFIDKVCGKVIPESAFKSTNQNVTVRFVSDATMGGTGFEFIFTAYHTGTNQTVRRRRVAYNIGMPGLLYKHPKMVTFNNSIKLIIQGVRKVS